MAGGFAIASKGEHVGQLTLSGHLDQGFFQLLRHLLAGRTGQGRAMVGIETTLAIDAVEAAYFAVGRHQVDAK